MQLNNLWRDLLPSDGEGKPSALPACLSVVIGANAVPKPGSREPHWDYSKRRISTGRSLAAARAGTRVAPMEITMAATAIHSPSRGLG